MPTIRRLADLRDSAKISELCAEKDEPIYITKNGCEHLVVMSAKTYERQQKQLELYRKLCVAEEQLASGVPLRDLDAVYQDVISDMETANE